ncbi:MAG: hypothetical protein V7711_06515 [Pseudomonadales bacterium]
MPEPNTEDFAVLDDSRFNVFFYDKSANFSNYDTVLLYPMTFDRLTISKKVSNDLNDSWKESTFKEMDKICGYFDEFAKGIFSRSKNFPSGTRGGENVLAIEVRMIEFFPTDLARGTGMGTIGTSSNLKGVGALTYHIVILESQTGRLVAMVKDTISINSGNFAVSNNPTVRNQAWRRAFQRVAENLHAELNTMSKLTKTDTENS